MAARGHTFASPLNTVMAYTPGISTAEKNDKDNPLYRTIDTEETWGYDIHNFVVDKRCKASVDIRYGQRGNAKTSSLMSEVISNLKRPGYKGMYYKTFADNNRMNDETSEWKSTCNYAGVEETRLRDKHINSLHPAFNFTYPQLLDMSETMLETFRGGPLNDRLAEMLTIATHYMHTEYRDETKWARLPYILRRLNQTDITEVQNLALPELRKSPAESSSRFANRDPNNDPRDMVSVGYDLAGIIDRFIVSKFGQSFAGEYNIIDDMDKRLFVKDYADLDEEVIGATHIFFARVSTHGIINKDHRLRADRIANDENYIHWRKKNYARTMSDLNKQIRGKGIHLSYLTHRPKDYETVAGVGDEQTNLATNAIRDVDVVWMGKQDPITADEMGARYGLSTDDTNFMKNCGIGEWLVKVGDEPATRVQTRYTKRLAMMTKHDIASEALATR